jgi:outer membrane lipoprotein-sorting protein
MCACACVLSIPARSAFAAPDFKEMLRTVDDQVSFTSSDFSAEYTIVQDKPGEGRIVTVAALFRRDRKQQYLILILNPESDKGKGYLKNGQILKLYDPKGRVFKSTSAKERFLNSNASNSDFTKSNFAGDYDVAGSVQENLDGRECWVLDLKANKDSVTYQRTKIWISAENLVRKMEDYSPSGQLLRTTFVPSYQKVGSKYVPVSMMIEDALKGRKIGEKMENERTQITIAKPSLQSLPDSLFTEAYLEKFQR